MIHYSDGTLLDLAIYHVTSGMVHRKFLFQAEEKAVPGFDVDE